MTQPAAIDEALTRLARDEAGRVLSLVAARVGDLDLADEAVQDALVDAARTWPTDGVPDNPPAWLLSVARRRAIDRIRTEQSQQRRAEAVGRVPAAGDATDASVVDALVADDGDLGDERLRLLCLCCHPALDRDTQVALTLRLVGGLTTAEIANAFLLSEPTVAQRIVRAKRKIRAAGIPLRVPDDLTDRLDALASVLYLVFNEGYLASRPDEDERTIRLDLGDEAIRLTRVLVGLVPGEPEVVGLLALQLYQQSRAGVRVDGSGDLVLLGDQDRTRWSRPLIEEGNQVLRAAMRHQAPGPYQLQAVIASLHANAVSAEDTDWPSIVSAYDALVALHPSPVVELNRAVALSYTAGPHDALALVDAIAGLDDYHLFHATRGELLRRCGDDAEANAADRRAQELTDNPAERRLLERRLTN